MRRYILLLTLLMLPVLTLRAQNEVTSARSAEVAAEPDTVETQLLTPAQAIDTLDTEDKYMKIVIYENFTWAYYDLGHPAIDTAGFYEGWDPEKIHAFKEVPVDSLPAEIDLRLVDSLHPFCVPVPGSVRSSFRFRGRRPHKGVDLPLQIGDTVRAAFDGVVRYSDKGKETGGYGGLVIIRHDNGLETYYAHLSKRLVFSGDLIKAGEALGLGGSTGRSTGPHLHFETRYMGKAFDPERIVDFRRGTIRDSLITLKRHYFNVYSHYGMTDEESKAASGRIIYVVRKGDNLGRIAAKYGTTVSAICKLNKISSKSLIKPGQRLIVR
ncbi:MAG: peptidoglycan DD-metalloendopeptidase family protein [Bacteroidales bacterium]|nr:peptidoglycan DD-metalloendopeptidase family protein [Bacteroidales bacterium]